MRPERASPIPGVHPSCACECLDAEVQAAGCAGWGPVQPSSRSDEVDASQVPQAPGGGENPTALRDELRPGGSHRHRADDDSGRRARRQNSTAASSSRKPTSTDSTRWCHAKGKGLSARRATRHDPACENMPGGDEADHSQDRRRRRLSWMAAWNRRPLTCTPRPGRSAEWFDVARDERMRAAGPNGTQGHRGSPARRPPFGGGPRPASGWLNGRQSQMTQVMRTRVPGEAGGQCVQSCSIEQQIEDIELNSAVSRRC